MADKTSPNGNGSNASNFLPKLFQTDSNKKFIQATIDQLVQPGTVKKVNGYIGRQNAKASSGADVFIKAPTNIRQQYQLEPGLVINDQLGNNTFFKDYQDYINQLGVFGSNTTDHSRLNKQEVYSWDPHIAWDKFVNFQNYYWLPYGPTPIAIYGQQLEITSTFQVSVEDELGTNAYIFQPPGLDRNPTIKLYRGQTYTFEINSPGNPFSIKTQRVSGNLERYIIPTIDNYAVELGTITVTIPYNSPDVLFYVSETDVNLGGVFEILSIENNTSINVDVEIIDKKTYVLPNGTALSNGMKIQFLGNVSPAKYSTGFYYVEGVGTGIRLVKESDLELISAYTQSEAILFDTTPFDSMPFSDATAFAGEPDYMVVNRSSPDRNPWSRYNRWFHVDTINTSATYNGQIASIDQNARAVRPIIEFDPCLRLFNFGTTAVPNVDLVDSFTTDVFSTIEGSTGYNVDGVFLTEGARILFTADTDRLVKNNIYRVQFVVIQNQRQIHLELEETPVTDNVALVTQGVINQGEVYWFNGTTWKLAQQKTKLNQPPLFDIFDNNKISYSDSTAYPGSSFKGTPVFSYKVGNGSADPTLGIPLSYRNISNIGDIVFNFNLASDSFQYKNLATIVTENINVGYLEKTQASRKLYVNGWQLCTVPDTQSAMRIYKNSNKINNFDIDIFDDITNLSDLTVKIYVNGTYLDKKYFSIVDGVVYKQIVLTNDISLDDILTIKAYTRQPVNATGYYGIPLNLQNNPLNAAINNFTLGEVIDHVNSIKENLPRNVNILSDLGNAGSSTVGNRQVEPDPNNIRDLGNVTQFGTKFVQHAGPASLSLYHITSDTNNVIRALEVAREEYNKFKRNFIAVSELLGIDTDTVRQVDLILEKINKDKPRTSPYYFSDMVPYGATITTELTVVDYRIKSYPLTTTFSLAVLSTQAVIVYHNGVQLLVYRDYVFDDQGFIVLTNKVNLQENDKIKIYEYPTTNGSFVPATPTKLGIWPKYEPKIYLDTTLITPRTMIQGHDGSLVLAYGDYRDDLILELEKRIFNNIKVEYNPEIFDINELMPNYSKTTDYSLEEFNQVLAPSFYKWTSLVDRDFTKPLTYDRSNPFSYNFTGFISPTETPVPGYWRGIYRWMLGTDRPNLCPWEILGFSIEPAWWQDLYGPAPYTKDNLPMWQDITDGIVREPGKPPVTLEKFIKPFLINHIPVDDLGNIASPVASGLAQGIITTSTEFGFVFGDVSPVEAAWRRSSFYPFSVLLTAILLQPSKTLGLVLDRSRIIRNLAGQLVYADTKLCITPQDISIPSIYSSTSSVLTSGVINYIADYILSDNLKSYTSYEYDLTNLSTQLSYRVGGFTSKEKFNFILDSKTPLSQGSVFIPQEDYSVILNSSNPIKKLTYSGVIITKLPVGPNYTIGYEIKGYSKSQPYFKYYRYTHPGISVNIGGISESFMNWTLSATYAIGKVVKYNNKYYRTKLSHTTTKAFDIANYEALAELPTIGGQNANFRKEWDRTDPITVPYGITFSTVQDVVDFLLGYGEYLKDQGFIFDEFNSALGAVTNWETSAKEFMFWTTQNWSTGQDKWDEWTPTNEVLVGNIVRFNGDYYRATNNIPVSPIFDETRYVKLEGLSTIGSSVIALSPAAAKITFSTSLAVVDDIKNPFNGYEIFKVDGTPIAPNFLNSYRDNNEVSYAPSSQDGIYGAVFYLVQKEQVILLNNTTMFNDTIYNPATGYKQERIKIAGYVSTDWYGGFDVPGFIFDNARIQSWTPWQDYALGDIVKFKEFYYSASAFLPGTDEFNPEQWIKLDKKPSAALLPNWSYKASQFLDFYDLDSDNFDLSQQTIAQHLVGYQKRQYLDNIIQDEVSEFKFYQGMIAEKGTQNVLNKLFDVLSGDNKESLTFYEEWAIRLGQYGASSAYENIEFKLDEQLFKNNPQGFELISSGNTASTDFIIRQTPNNVYLKPLGYNSKPWPVLPENSLYLRTPGYVRSSDVLVTLTTIDTLLTQKAWNSQTTYSINNTVNYNKNTYVSKTSNTGKIPSTTSADWEIFKVGDYIWCGFEGQSWNVYKYTNGNLKINNVTYDPGTLELTITTDHLVNLKPGNIIGIAQVTAFSGFYKIVSVSSTSFTVEATIPGWSDPFTEQDKMVVFTLLSQRVASIDAADSVIPRDLRANDLLWSDNAGNGKWATWKYNPVYSETEIATSTPQDGLAFGRQVILNKLGNVAAVSNSLGEIIIYDKASPRASWIQRQTIPSLNISINNPQPELVGDVLAVSPDGRWLATGAPLVGRVASTYKGAWFSLTVYAVGDVVVAGTTYYTLIAVPPTYNYPPSEYPTYWKKVPYITVDLTAGTDSVLVSQGIIALYEKDKNNTFSLIDVILSPAPANNEKFGSNIVFGNNTMFVSAVGNNSSTGAVYQLSYLTTVKAAAFYNPIGSDGITVSLSTTQDIKVGMTVVGNGFTKSQQVINVVNGTTIIVSAAPDSTPSGTLQFTVTEWQYVSQLPSVATTGNQFGYFLAISQDGNTLTVTSPTIGVTPTGTVYVYKNQSGAYVRTQTILGTDSFFGQTVSVSVDGAYIAIGSPLTDKSVIDQGSVKVYQYNVDQYQLYQDLANVRYETAELFGSKVSFMNDFRTLVVYSQNADSVVPFTLTDNTTFDNDSTSFYISNNVNSGRIDIYDRYGDYWIFSESLTNNNTVFSGYGRGFTVGNNVVYVGVPYAVRQSFRTGTVYQYSKSSNSFSWNKTHYEIATPDIKKIKQAFLYNTTTNKLIKYLDVLDSNQGKIPGIADQEISYKTFYDPATYSIGSSLVNVDDGMSWDSAQVGKLWWDLRTSKFINSYDNDVVYRNSTWNSLFPGASIDVYEWVQSSYLPADWDALSETENGVPLGISGTSLYGNTAYSQVKRYDNISNSFKYTYFYWVKNKKTTPNVYGRHMPAIEVANLIANPRGQGYEYLAITSENSFSLVNVKPLLEDSNVALSVEYWTVDQTDQNIHTQWRLISNNSDTDLPNAIEEKWFDSLCGKDSQGRVVPDFNLPIKLRYGIENRPRQGMFVNRFETLKQIIEQANRVLIKNQIVEQKDISLLQTYEKEPSKITGLYDTVLDTDAELRFANVGSFTVPTLTPIITDGKLTGINIINSGSGYLTAPFIIVTGTGLGAVAKTIINRLGQVTGVTIISAGHGYNSSTTLSVRNYSVLVHSDANAAGNWSIYGYEPLTSVWSRTQTQSYDTRKYWEYIDWYGTYTDPVTSIATSYNQFTAIDFAVPTLSELNGLEVQVGQIVKILTDNSGNWLLLLKYATSASIDWTQSYQVIGAGNGTIQFKPVLYQFIGTEYGYDGTLYDSGTFDNTASIELRNILIAIKNNIFIDTLKQEYLNLFFTSVHYALSEQTYVDWIFKTSFVKAQHNVGELKQKVTYNNDNLSDFESYVAEVKPYRTKVREYVSEYTALDTSRLSITDFDLPPVYQDGSLNLVNTQVVDGKIQVGNPAVQTYPWKHWLDNVGFIVTDLKIVNGGAGYITEPTVRFVSNSGSGASARAFISNGRVNRIVILSKGTGYLSAPTVIIDGGLSTTGTAAQVVAIIGDSLVRSTLVKMKFDRITQNYFITQLEKSESFTGSGSRLQWPLMWAPDIRVGKSTVTINGVDAIRDSYKLAIVKSTSRGYTSYSGTLTFTAAPAVGDTIEITYLKDWSLLNAADRIQFYYNPESGMLGKDLSQLMTGIDYGGVIVDGLGFDVSSGWGSLPYFTDKWDSVDATFDDYITTTVAGERDFILNYVPEAGTKLNVYYAPLNVDTYLNTDGVTTEYEFNANDIYPPKLTATSNVRSVSDSPNNTASSKTLTINSTAGLKVGDTVEISLTIAGQPIDQVVLPNTRIVQIINGTDLSLNQIIYKNIPYGSNATAVFSRTLVTPTDAIISRNGLVTLVEPLAAGFNFKVSAFLAPVRIDALNFTTYDILDPYVVMPTVISTGVPNVGTTNKYTVTLPATIPGIFEINDGDTVIIRKTTSDGSIKPQDTDYDTALTGGDLAYSSATGLAADDIIVDGDGFVTSTSSPAPEEVVPGQVVDAVAIKVFDAPSTGTANIRVDNYIADGTITNFVITQIPNSPQAVFVKVDSVVQSANQILLDGDYTIDYRNSLVKFNVAPTLDQVVSIFSIGVAGSNILDVDYFVGDGSTIEFITRAPWLVKTTALVYVDGQPTYPLLFETDTTYTNSQQIGFRFTSPPPAGSLINFIIVSGLEQTFSVTKTQQIAADNREDSALIDGTLTPLGTSTYDLDYIVGSSLPNESNMIVRVDQTILKGPNNSYFTIKNNKLTYTIDPSKFLPYSISIDDITVLVNGTLLSYGTDYTARLGGITIKINRRVYDAHKGEVLIISVNQGVDYRYVGGAQPSIIFNQVYGPGQLIEVTSSYNHRYLDIENTSTNVASNAVLTPDTPSFYNYTGISSGHLLLDRPVINDSYVWLTKNGTLLSPSVDFKLNSNKSSITLTAVPDQNDSFTLITFGNNVLGSVISYMQFKDMLNRVVFKRLSLKKQTRLSADVSQTDTTIIVDDVSQFDIPNAILNRPGIIEINGERIEYFTLDLDNNVLGQLRRGTLGTGVPQLHRVGTIVQEIGASETIPYQDTAVTERISSDGTNFVPLSFVPTATDITHWFTNFGYNLVTTIDGGHFYQDTVQYAVNDVIVYGDYYYVNTVYYPIKKTAAGDAIPSGIIPPTSAKWRKYSSVPNFYGQADDIEVFVAGTRLKKAPYKVYSVSQAPESPEGDVQFDAEFAVDSYANSIRLTVPPALGTQITVVKRQGRLWDGYSLDLLGQGIRSGNLASSIQKDNSNVASFLKDERGSWYTEYHKYTRTTPTFDSTVIRFDDNDTTFDNGITDNSGITFDSTLIGLDGTGSTYDGS
jgi:hypothetical protein